MGMWGGGGGNAQGKKKKKDIQSEMSKGSLSLSHTHTSYINIYIYIYIVCHRNPAEQESFDKPSWVKKFGLKVSIQPGDAWTVVLCSLSLSLYIYMVGSAFTID